MKINYQYIFALLSFLLLIVGLGSCKDDLILAEDAPVSWRDDGKGGIVFALDASHGGFGDEHHSMVSKIDEETVINPHNFVVALFGIDGSVKEIWENQELAKIKEDDPVLGERTKYFVRIPRKDINENTINYIRKNKFKLAVFANWAGYPDLATTEKKDELNGLAKNFIFYITHCREDASYLTDQDEDGNMMLDFLTGPGHKMGIAQEWVANRFESDEEAATAIRNKYKLNSDGTGKFVSDSKPRLENAVGTSVEYNGMDTYSYNDVWQVWNFGGEKNYEEGDKIFYQSDSEDLRQQWAEVNNDWYNTAYDTKEKDSDGLDANKKIESGTSIRGLTVYHPSNMSVQGVKYRQPSDGRVYYCLQMKDTKRGTDITQIKESDGSYLHLKVPADGYMYIKCRARAEGGGMLIARRGALTTTASSVKQTVLSPGNDQIYTFTLGCAKSDGKIISNDGTLVRVTGEPEDFVIYATGGEVEIFEIDYIKSRMIQYTDRQMINPASTPEGGISMYGIQDFEPADTDVWPDGTTFNFSRYESTHTGTNAGSYKYRTVSLLRSVSKVEVYVPKSIFPQPSHMFLRTINRYSRSAPVDVFTPTNIIWDGWEACYSDYGKDLSPTDQFIVKDMENHDHIYSVVPGIDQEVENIRRYGFMYEADNSDLHSYKNAIAWLFALWNVEFGWNWAGQNIEVDPEKPRPYPRIFNTRIDRSDYAHMIYGGEVEDNYYYYAYLPEKNITDPNTKGQLNESPKVMRIEMRFDDRNSDVNLDDNAAYRIYFMPGGKGLSSNNDTNRDSYDTDYERGNDNDESVQMQNLHNMYPVVRNHLYKFKITGIDMNGLNVDFEVKGPDTRDINYTFD